MSSLPETKFPSVLESVLSLLISSNTVYCLGCYDHIYNKFYFWQDMCPMLGATHIYVLQNLCCIDIPIMDANSLFSSLCSEHRMLSLIGEIRKPTNNRQEPRRPHIKGVEPMNPTAKFSRFVFSNQHLISCMPLENHRLVYLQFSSLWNGKIIGLS